MVKHYCIGISLLFSALFGLARAEAPLQRFSFSEPHMGTTVGIVLYAADEKTAKAAAAAAFARIAELDGIMSDYRPTSELMKLCEKAGSDAVPVSDDLFKVLLEADKVARATNGAFDVTVGPVVRLWRKARRTRELPSAEALKKALALVDYKSVRLDPQARTVRLLLIGMLLDLGGIGKGYAADAALAVLRRQRIRHALIVIGGDVTVAEPPPNSRGWKVGIAPLKNPEGKPSHYLSLQNASVSTSGDAAQFVEIDGIRYSHIVDPRTGLGLVGRRSATVIAANGTRADSLATAICVLGPKRGLPLIEANPETAALYVHEEEGRLVTLPSIHFAKFEER